LFAALQLAFMKWLPGPTYLGPETANGCVPVYKANGRLAYSLTLTLFFLGGFVFKWFRPGIVYGRRVFTLRAVFPRDPPVDTPHPQRLSR
jgi:hypothetical protein